MYEISYFSCCTLWQNKTSINYRCFNKSFSYLSRLYGKGTNLSNKPLNFLIFPPFKNHSIIFLYGNLSNHEKTLIFFKKNSISLLRDGFLFNFHFFQFLYKLNNLLFFLIFETFSRLLSYS